MSTKPDGVTWFRYAAKAAISAGAGFTAAAGSLAVAITDGSDGGTAVTTPEWLQVLIVAGTAVLGTLGVYKTKNQETP